MSLFKDLDVASAADDPFKVDDGTYLTTVTSCKIQETKDGKKGLTFDFTIDDDAEHNANEAMHGRKISEWLTIPDTTDDGEFVDPEKGPIFLSFIKRRLKSLGIPEDEMNTVDHEDLIGIQVVTTVKTKNDYQNITKMVLANETAGDGWS